MLSRQFCHIAAFCCIGALWGCSSTAGVNKTSSDYQTYEVISSAEDIDANAAIGLIKANDQYGKNAERRKLDGNNNLPGGDITSGITGFVIRPGESLYSVTNRLIPLAKFSRLIYDLTPNAPSPDSVLAKDRISTQGGSSLLGEIQAAFSSNNPNLKIFAASDGNSHALVISDKGYPRWETLKIFDVKAGNLRDSTRDLANSLGWHLDVDKDWLASNFQISTSYPIVIIPANPRLSLSALLGPYPVQAQLNQNTRHVTAIPRVQPKQN